MIQELTEESCANALSRVQHCLSRTTPFHENPIICDYKACGAIRGLDVPIRTLLTLSRDFHEESFFILSQSLKQLESYSLLRVNSSIDPKVAVQEINKRFPSIFAADTVFAWGELLRWVIVFDPELSLGVLAARSSSDAAICIEGYNRVDRLIDVSRAFSECVKDELKVFPQHSRSRIEAQLFNCWGVRRFSSDSR
jgi:hypothetical protein